MWRNYAHSGGTCWKDDGTDRFEKSFLGDMTLFGRGLNVSEDEHLSARAPAIM